MKYHIECPHFRGVPIEETVPDYYPLTYDELVTLLETAQAADANHFGVVCSIQMRLVQALPGMVCPRPSEEQNPLLAQKDTWIDKQFCAHYRAGDLPTMAADFYALMRD